MNGPKALPGERIPVSTKDHKSKPVYSELEEEISTLDQIDDELFDDVDFDQESIISDGEDDAIFCAVCEQTFDTRRILDQHRVKKRHFFCTICEDIFSDGAELQIHKEETDHYDQHYTDDEWEQETKRDRHCSVNNELPHENSEMESLL